MANAERAPNPDQRLVDRANAYGRRVADIELAELTSEMEALAVAVDSPVSVVEVGNQMSRLQNAMRRALDNATSNAFVVGYAAGFEDATTVMRHRMPSGAPKRNRRGNR